MTFLTMQRQLISSSKLESKHDTNVSLVNWSVITPSGYNAVLASTTGRDIRISTPGWDYDWLLC